MYCVFNSQISTVVNASEEQQAAENNRQNAIQSIVRGGETLAYPNTEIE